MARALTRKTKQNEMAGPPVQSTVFSAYISSICTSKTEWKGNAKIFVPPWTFRHEIEAAILTSPNKKAPGLDGIKNEMLKVDVSLSTRLIFALWEACGRLATTPDLWRRTVLVPIFKEGNPNLPENYRPISLISHIRKIVESALNRLIGRHYQPHPSQLGSRKTKALSLPCSMQKH